MGLRISTNIPSVASARLLNQTMSSQGASYKRLASGQRITQAGDDPAGLAIAEDLRMQIRSTDQAIRNANFGVSFAQVAEGALSEVTNIMIRLRELGVQSSSDTVGDRERIFINSEAQSLIKEVDRIANVTSFSGVPLLNGQSSKSTLEFQVGIRNTENDRISLNVGNFDMRANSLGIDGINYESIDGGRDAFERIEAAMTKVFETRASLAAIQNNLQSSVRTSEVSKENLAAARSQIADTDIAEETSNLARTNILQSAGIAVLAQANMLPERVLKLI